MVAVRPLEGGRLGVIDVLDWWTGGLMGEMEGANGVLGWLEVEHKKNGEGTLLSTDLRSS